jgi:hypothetical protein
LKLPIVQDAGQSHQSRASTYSEDGYGLVTALKKNGNYFQTVLTRFHCNRVVGRTARPDDDGLCYRIVTISTAVCNKSSPAFACANFQAGIFSEPAMDGLVLLNRRVQIWKMLTIAEK